MSVYPPPSHRRQPSNASSIASSYVSNYFPESRSNTVTSVSSLSSRFNNNSPTKANNTETDEQAPPAGMSRVASIYSNGRESPPALGPRSTAQAPRPAANLYVRNSYHEGDATKLGSADHFRFPPPASPSPLSTSPTKSPPGSPVKRVLNAAKEFNRRSISFADASIPDDLSAMRHSSVSHLRTLSQISNGGASEFNEVMGGEVAGLHGRKRLQRAQTDSLSSWDRMTWMDKRRQYIQAYEYLCHIGEAKEWMEECIGEPIPAIVELEEALRDGVTLAKLVRVFAPELVPRIFDAKKLQFRHSDNINRFFQFVKQVQLPEIFLFELTDLYNKKNIPKVIYCIHALSFLLFRLGMTKIIIGNLVGKLEFTEAEIQNTQKGLDQAGVILPNFRGVNKHFEPEPEPEETEEERTERELGECEFSIKRLQRAARGALVRLRLGDTVEELWSYEEEVIQLQAAIRGMFARIRYAYNVDRNAWAKELQAVARGYLIRKAIDLKLRSFTANERLIVRLQARYRGNKVRAETKQKQQKLAKSAGKIVGFQAAIRGALARRAVEVQAAQAHESEDGVTRLQALARGALLRKSLNRDAKELKAKSTDNQIVRLQAKARGMLLRKSLKKCAEALTSDGASDAIEDLQAAARGLLVRQAMKEQKQQLQAADDEKLHQLQANIRGFLLRAAVGADMSALEAKENTWTRIQAAVKGMLVRQEVHEKQEQLESLLPSIVKMQAVARGWLARDEYEDTLELLEEAEDEIVDLQALTKGYLLRKEFRSTVTALDHQLDSVIQMQGICRGHLTRKHHNALLAELESTSESVARLQAQFRGAVVRGQVADTLAYLDDEEDAIIVLQALARGMMQREKFQDKLKFYNDNMQKVIKIQSFVRAKQQGEAYRSLTEGKNPPVGTIKNFVHLLNDSDFDFDEEIEFERLRKNVVQHVAANEMAENYIDQLDIKIALLVKNKITLDEVIKHQKRFTGHVGGLLSNVDLASSDPFDLKALNKNSRRKLELYQMLFFALQTQPVYLARLFTNVREQGTPEKDLKRTENLIMGLFGYAQKRREEYYLLKLITRSVKEDVDRCATLQDFLRGNFFWVKLLQSYTRNPKDRKFLKDILGPILKERIIDNRHLNLESDPLRIYHSSIGDEELRTGKKSSRRHSIGREEAIRDPETRATFIERLQHLRDISSAVLDNLDHQLPKMPYGIRYIARQSYEALCERFPNESPDAVLQVVVHFIYQKYFKPAIVGPDTFGIVAKTLDEKQKKNLGELSKLLNQLSLGKQFSHDNIYLLPLNEYVAVNIRRLHEIFVDVIEVKEAETQFDIDEFDDLTSRQKPTLYMKMAEIFSIHRMVAQKIDVMSPSREDQLRDIIRELGSVKANETELRTMANAEITLYLNPRFQKVEDPDSEMKALMVETKRCILYIIRIQTGGDLMEILVKPVRQEDEDRWRQLLEEEHSGKRRGAYADTTTLSDVSSMTYTDLKRTALENIVRLEQAGKITRKNHYQDLLNAIAVDIRTKHRRRVQRQKELENVRGTLTHLNEKATYLEQQLQSYNDYIEQAMQTLQSKKGKRRTILPFTRQYFHIRELQRSGKVPKFGSYNYSARALADKGVLATLENYPESKWGSISITIQSDEVGIFRLEMSYGSMIIPGGSMDIPLDDLLQAQFNNNQFMMLFEGMAKVNVNLFLHLLFRKFYRDE